MDWRVQLHNIKHFDMQLRIALLLCLVVATALALESREHNYYSNPYTYSTSSNKKSSSDDDTAAGIFIIIVILFVIGCSYFFCCRRCFNRNPTQLSANQNQFAYPPYNPNFNPNLQMQNPSYPIPPPYQAAYNPPRQQTMSRPTTAVNPYIINERLTQLCDMCSIKNKMGEEPRVLLNCSGRHLFHLSCISFVIQSPNFICPRCRENCSQTIALYCSGCKDANFVLAVSDFLKPAGGGLDVDAIKAKYGQYCPGCN